MTELELACFVIRGLKSVIASKGRGFVDGTHLQMADAFLKNYENSAASPVPVDASGAFREVINDAVALLAAIRAVASDWNEWEQSADHFHKEAGIEIRKLNAALSHTAPVADAQAVEGGL